MSGWTDWSKPTNPDLGGEWRPGRNVDGMSNWAGNRPDFLWLPLPFEDDDRTEAFWLPKMNPGGVYKLLEDANQQ